MLRGKAYGMEEARRAFCWQSLRRATMSVDDGCPSITCASTPHAPSSADDPLWMLAEPAVISHFHSASSGHRPATECSALLCRKQARWSASAQPADWPILAGAWGSARRDLAR
jgi:hypothetical protein